MTSWARRQGDQEARRQPPGPGVRRPRPPHRRKRWLSRQVRGQTKGVWREAKKVEAKLLEQVDRGERRGGRTRTVGELVERWLEWRQQVRPISPVTVANYRGAIDRYIRRIRRGEPPLRAGVRYRPRPGPPRQVIRFHLLPIDRAVTTAERGSLGRPFRRRDEDVEITSREAIAYRDPDAAGRGLRAHNRLQNQLSDPGGGSWLYPNRS